MDGVESEPLAQRGAGGGWQVGMTGDVKGDGVSWHTFLAKRFEFG